MTTKTAILSRESKTCALEKLIMQFDESKDLFVTISDDKAKIRSNAQNALIHVYYKAISDFRGEEVEDVTARCKRKFGLPIMEKEAYECDTEKSKKVFRELLRVGLINNPTPPEQAFILTNYHNINEIGQIECFKLIAVTRNFSSTQMKQYIESMERFWAQKGLVLESINETKRREAFCLIS